MIWFRALLVWLVLAVAMVAHGTARERYLVPRLGDLRAHQVSCFTGSLIVVALTWAALPWMRIAGSPELQWKVGGLWLGVTVAFEFVFGRWVAGHSWSRLLHDYDVRRGRLWLLVLAATFAAPRLAGALHAWRAA